MNTASGSGSLTPSSHAAAGDGTADATQHSRSSFLARSLIVLCASLVIGGLTSFGQQYIPHELNNFANSVSGWTMVTVVLIWFARVQILPSAFLGAGSFVLLVLGYALASNARGFDYNPDSWLAVAVVAGPVVGASASALRAGTPLMRAMSAGVIGGLLLGDGVHGYVFVIDTTSWVYWTIVSVLGVALLVVVATRLRTMRLVAIELCTAALAGGALAFGLQLVYDVVNGFFTR